MNKLSNSLLPIVLAAVPLSFAQLSNAEQNNGVATKKTTGFATPELDKVVISAHSFDQGQHEMSQPATLLTDEDLDRQRANSLGETLSKQVGIHNSSYGTAVGRPVIRGMSGARVKVLQDGIDSLDASAVSPDHSINVDTFGAQKVEVLRGPATLMYGSGAFGGVVNVVDSRVPTGLEESETSLSMQYDTVNEGKTLGFRNNGFTDLADGNELHWKISGSHFRSEEYELPKLKNAHEEHHDHHEGETEAEHEEHASDDVLANSDTAYNNQLAIGSSYVFASGYVGLAISQSKSEYGLPGHVHHDEHEHEGDGARIKMRQQRIDLDSRWDQPTAGIESVKFRLGFNDYRHDEVEGGEVVTEFRRKGYEGRTEVLLSPIADISQALGLQFSQDTFKSGNASENSGELAVPETDSATVGAFWLGKTQLAGWGVELGTRLEQAQISPDSPAAINASCGALTVNGYEDKKFNTHSASLGVLRDLDFAAMNDWQFTASVTSAQRAPTAQELFSCGAHGATQTFDLGNPDLDVEQALNFELGLRKIQGRLTTGLNLYQNNINDYIYAQNTGLEVNGYGQYQYVQSDVKFIGAEVDAAYQLLQGLTLTAMADRVRADDLPRIPADRIGMGFELSTMALFSSAPDWMVFGKWQQVQKQDQVADNEESSLGYDLVSLGMSYQAVLPNSEYRIDLKANNLLDEEIRQHTSFVKEQAPQPGRNISLGVAVTF